MPFAPQRHAPSRDASIDTLRGLLLVLMGLNHIPAALRWLSDQPLGYVSSAEGFFFLSGLVAGKVYTTRARRPRSDGLGPLCAQRALHLYRAHVLTVLGVFGWSWSYCLLTGDAPPGAEPPFMERPWAALLASLTLLYQPGLLDILPVYVGMMLLLPLVLSQLELGRRAWVVGGSLLWWALTNVFDSPIPYYNGLILTGAFNFGAWQVLFVSGAVAGHAWADGRPLVARPRGWLLACLLGVAALLCAARHGLIPLPLAEAQVARLTNKVNVAPLRLLDTALLFYLVRWVMQRVPLRSRALSLIGQKSLVAFSVHVVVATMVLAFPHLFAATLVGRCLGPVLLIGAMLVAAWIATRLAPSTRSARATEPLLAARELCFPQRESTTLPQGS